MNVLGIPVRLHWSFLILVLACIGYGAWIAGLNGAFAYGAMMLGLSVSGILHELGHALAARKFGIGTEYIALYFFGGTAAIRMPENPKQEFIISVAGPLVNVVLAALGSAVWLATDHWLGQQIVLNFVLGNLFLGAFNLIPAFPMDGGRMFFAFLTWVGFHSAHQISVWTDRIFAGMFFFGGMWYADVSLLAAGLFSLIVSFRSVDWQAEIKAESR